MHIFRPFPRLARDSSVLVFLGPIREQACSWPFRILTVVGTYSHGTAASEASGFSAFAPLPLAPSLRPPSPRRFLRAAFAKLAHADPCSGALQGI